MRIYVDAAAARGGDGSKNSPFHRINDAAQVAKPGDEVLVLPGVYREYVNPRNAGTEEARIVYRSTEPLGAVITGAEPVKNWLPYEGTTWVARVDNRLFGDYNPYTTEVGGDWYFAPEVRHTGAVFLNDSMLYETVSLEECLEGKPYAYAWYPETSIYKWFAVQDGFSTVIYANFQGKDPNAENVEISVRRNCFMPDRNEIGYITLSGFKVCKAATTWAPPAAYQDGMVGPHWSKGWIIEDCEICHSKCCGISLGKYYDPENDHYFTRHHLKSPTQMERDAVCRGQYHGWLKERIGSHIVRRCHIHHCEQAGIVGRMGAVFSVLEDNHIHDISTTQQLGGAETAGIKLHAAIDVTFRRNHIHHCVMGIWCDWEAQGTRITQNLLHDNERPAGVPLAPGVMSSQDIFVEVSHGPTLIDNNVLLSGTALCFATEGVALVHNLILGVFGNVGAGTGTRYCPYHIRHRTEVAGFMTILHGDDRFYNNIFIQGPKAETSDYKNHTVGTSPFDEYPTYEEWIAKFMIGEKANMMALEPAHMSHLPVWAKGNVYLNGAQPWQKENDRLVVTDGAAEVRLEQENGAWILKTNLPELLGDYRAAPVTSDVLGNAFEPDQRFENPDGTEIRFTEDYLGSPRGSAVVPGPFAIPAERVCVK